MASRWEAGLQLLFDMMILVMAAIPVWDGHCDSLTKWRIEDLLNDKAEAHWTLPKFRKGGGDLQFLAIYTPPEYIGKDAFHYAMKYMEAAHELVEQSSGAAKIVLNRKDLQEATRDETSSSPTREKRDETSSSPTRTSSGPANVGAELASALSPIKLVLSLEGAAPLMGSIHNLRLFHRLGLRALGFTWNHRNELADGVGVAPGPSGLTEAGFAVLKECERLGILADVSHLSEPGFWDVYNACTKPFIASHSNAKAFCNYRRNLTDKQIEAVAERGGSIGLTFVRDFVVLDASPDTPPVGAVREPPSKGTGTSREGASPPAIGPSPLSGGGGGGGDPALPVLVQHARHIGKVGGIQSVALGSDFDGTDGPVVADASEFSVLASALGKSGFTDADVNAIFGANLRRVLMSIL